jgi:hypothetical protein
MQRLSISALAATALLVSCTVPSLAQTPFKPAEVTSAPDIQYPIRSIADGVVVLDVSLDDKGGVTAITVVRDIPSLTSVATASIPSWKFTPASRHGTPVSSTMRVAIVFRPPVYFAAGPSFSSTLSGGDSDEIGSQAYTPPGIGSVTYPQYPINAATPGTVVLQVTVNKSSTIEHLKVVRDLPPFAQVALSAANKWQFQAATLKGRPTTSNLAIAFIFTRPLSKR